MRRAGGRIEIGAYPARGLPRERQDRQRLRFERHRVRSVSLRTGPAQQRPAPRKHHRAHHHRDGRLRHARRRLEDRRALQRAQLRSEQRSGTTTARALRHGAVPDLRQAVAADPKLRVLIVHGWNDLSCPFMGSVLTVDQMPVMGDASRVRGAGISGRPHVLQPAGQPGRVAEGRERDVRQALNLSREAVRAAGCTKKTAGFFTGRSPFTDGQS